MKYLMLSILLCCSGYLFGQLDLGFIRDGNDAYKEKSYTNSEESYRRALELESTNYKGLFNLGNSIFQQGRYEEAVKHFESATAYAPDDLTRAQALHNLGNSHLKLQDYENSVKAYIEALKTNPGDLDTKYNLAYAMQKLKEQQQQQEKSDCDKGEEGEEGEEKEDAEEKDQEQKDQEQKDQEQKEQESKDKGEQGEEKQDQQQKDKEEKEGEKDEEQEGKDKQIENPEEGQLDSTLMTKKEMSMEEVLKILEIMDNEEQKVQQKLRAPKGDRKKTDKDW